MVQSQKLEEFIICFKKFVARRGIPQNIYSDNAKTFKAAAYWVKAIIKSERFQDGFRKLYQVAVQFTLSSLVGEVSSNIWSD